MAASGATSSNGTSNFTFPTFFDCHFPPNERTNEPLQISVAKEQGFRSRAAFKLTQINRKFGFLEKCHNAVLDLCAAPGGWTQVCARTCPKSVKIVAVDILPIRSVGSHNVTTLVGDITTDKCRHEISRALRGVSGVVDVVMHDGAPNVGAEYGKDAYEQNELSVHALKCATQHLKKGGTFVTKLYRSRDYAAYHYVLLQLFENVAAYKPKASRVQSAEIFLIAERYKAPTKLDPRFLDPKHVFEQVDGNTTGGTIAAAGAGGTAMTIFHKNWDKKVRKRGGYDMDHLDATMRHVESVTNFVEGGFKDAVQMLSRSTGLTFSCEDCVSGGEDDGVNSNKKCPCRFLLHHPFTTSDIKDCLNDLQVLNKTDFKTILTWRTKMKDAIEASSASKDDGGAVEEEGGQGEKGDKDGSGSDDDDGREVDSDEEEEGIQAEIEEMRRRRMKERKRQKKKERALAQKRRQRAALGTSVDFVDQEGTHGEIFRLATIQSKGQLDAAAEVNLDQVDDDAIFGGGASDDDFVVGGEDDEDDSGGDGEEEERARLRRREKELDEAYNQYLQTTKNGLAKSGTKMAKRSKKLMRQKVADEALDDQEMAAAAPSGIGHDTKTYIRMLAGAKGDNSDDDSDPEKSGNEEEDDDGFNADPMTPEEYAETLRARKRLKTATKETSNPLIHRIEDESSSVKTARWFSNPLFARIGEAVAQSTSAEDKGSRKVAKSSKDVNNEGTSSSDGGQESDSNSSAEGGSKRKRASSKAGISADEVLALIPRTDKQVRHERRLKQKAREERRKLQRAQRLGEALEDDGLGGPDFEIAPAATTDGKGNMDNMDIAHLSEAQQKKVIEARELIRAGMGTALDQDAEASKSKDIEIVAQSERPLPVMDERKYDSENEDYDSDDYARTLALGTMMLRRSKEKAFVDASYNRYAWNDPEELPEWFVDDENKHYRPQLPIPPALLAKMKEKMMALSQKPIAKVAEARARKSKRAKAKLAAAKKQAEAVANSSDMSEAAKLKAISKALRGQETRKPSKTYVVAKKGRGGMKAGGKGVKVVDKRLKADKRALDHIEKKRKKGKQNGLVGSKKRRHHR